MKIFGISLSRKKEVASKPDAKGKRGKASKQIKRQAKRDVSFEVKDIKRAIDMAMNVDNPDRSLLYKIIAYIIRDGHLISQIRTAIVKVQSEPWMLYKNDTPDIAASKKFRKKWFNKIIKYIIEKEFYGFTLVEIDEVDAANSNIGKVIRIDREYVCIEKQWILLEGSINGSYLPYGDIKKELGLMEFGDAEELGCLLECAYNVIWKYYARSDWSRANEKVGTPILTVEADTNNEDELDAMEERAANFGTDGYIIGQTGDKFGLLERKSDNFHLTFKELCALCNDEVSKIINGTSSVSDVKAFVGSAEVGERITDDFALARLQGVVDEMIENVFPSLIEEGFSLTDYEFDYPRLRRERERKINGLPTATDPKQEPNNPDPEPVPDPNKHKPKPQPKRKK